METLKILVFNWRDINHPEAGGAEVDVHEFARLASRWGHEVTLFTAQYGKARSREEFAGYRIVRRGNRFTVYLAARNVYRREFGRHGFDVILDHINGVPWFTPLYSRQPVVALLNHLVGFTFFQELPFPLAVLGWLAEASIPSVYGKAPIMVRTGIFRQDLIRAGYSAENIKVVHSGLDHETYYSDAKKASTPTIIFVGPVKAYKHPEMAFKVVGSLVREFPNLHLEVVGWDRNGLSSRLFQQAERMGIQNHVTFHGWVSENDKASLLRRAWLLVQASEREGWSYAVMEAAACGTPAVATAVGGMRESVQDGVSGVLVPYGDEERFVDTVRNVLLDESLRNRLSRGATLWAQQFSWERYANDVLEILRGGMILNQRCPRIRRPSLPRESR